MKEAGQIELNFNVTDTSNYMIEQSKIIGCGTDYFEIEILPEFGKLTSAVNNEIFVFTRDISGNPIKTYSTVKIGDYTKQLISDEKGIGSVIFTKEELSTLNSKTPATIIVESKDVEGNVVKKDEAVNFYDSYTTLIKTDKVKYDVGEDIDINVISKLNSSEDIIYVFKGKELIKTITFEGDNTKFNLEDTTGLIDIYIKNANYNNSLYTKRTIFIKPDQKLNIQVNLDQDEYKPGDSLNIEFVTTDETNSLVDSALLVSILDEAILSLADNDLSIDNIKLALEDIELTDGITAADLYASVLGNESNSLLMSVLLKQSESNPNLLTQRHHESEGDNYISRGLMFIIIPAIILIIWGTYKSKKVQTVVVNAFSILIWFVIVEIFFEYYDVSYVILGIGILLTLIGSLASMIAISRFSPLTILKERG